MVKVERSGERYVVRVNGVVRDERWETIGEAQFMARLAKTQLLRQARAQAMEVGR